MQWKKLLSARRLGSADNSAVQPGRSPFQQDFDRIVFSSSFRKLHDKAQVFPLSDEDNVRTRLTHSMETASIGRSLGAIAGVGICEKLGGDRIRPNHIGEIVAAASLAHDIGNPPFGHKHAQKTFLNSMNRSYVNSALLKSTRSQLAQLEKSISSHLYKRNNPKPSYAKASSSSLTPRNKSTQLIRSATPFRNNNNNKQHQRRSITPTNALKRSQSALSMASYADKSKRKKELHTPKHMSASSSATTSPNINNNVRTPTSKTPITRKKSSITSNLLKQIRLNSNKQSPSSNRMCCLRRNNISNVIISKSINETPMNKEQCCQVKSKANKMLKSNCNKNYNCGFIKQHNVNKLIENLEMSGNTQRRSNNNVNVNVVVINNGIINVSNSGSGLTSGRRQSKGSSTICGNTSYSSICTNNNNNNNISTNQRKRITKSNSMRFLFENYKMDSHTNVNVNMNMNRHAFIKHK